MVLEVEQRFARRGASRRSKWNWTESEDASGIEYPQTTESAEDEVLHALGDRDVEWLASAKRRLTGGDLGERDERSSS